MTRIVLAWALAPALLAAQTSDLLDRLDRTVQYRDVAISPDGSRVAWIEGAAASSPKVRISSVSGVAAPATTGFTDAQGECSEPAWSPDSSTIAVLCADHDSPAIWVANSRGEKAHRLAALRGYAAH